jgi:hypothetical protein
MTAGTLAATVQGPAAAAAVYQTPALHAYQLEGFTWMIGVGLLAM